MKSNVEETRNMDMSMDINDQRTKQYYKKYMSATLSVPVVEDVQLHHDDQHNHQHHQHNNHRQHLVLPVVEVVVEYVQLQRVWILVAPTLVTLAEENYKNQQDLKSGKFLGRDSIHVKKTFGQRKILICFGLDPSTWL